MEQRKSERGKEETRRALVDALFKVFARKGLFATTIDDVTQWANVGKGTFYQHFQSREEAIAAVMRRSLDLLRTRLEHEFLAVGPEGWVQRMVEVHVRYFAEDPQALGILHQARGWLRLGAEQTEPIRLEFERYFAAVAAIGAESLSERTVEEGGATASAPEIEAVDRGLVSRAFVRMLFGALTGLLLSQWTLGEGTQPSSAELESMVGEVLAALALHLGKGEAASPSQTGPVAMPTELAAGLYDAERFRQTASAWLDLLRMDHGLEAIREAVLERASRRLFHCSTDDSPMHDLDRVTVRDCIKVWQNLLHPRNERLADFSVLRTLVKAARGEETPGVTPAFWAEMCHLIEGIEGRVRFHAELEPQWKSGLRGRDAALARSDGLDALGSRMDLASKRYLDGMNPRLVSVRQENAKRIMASLGATTEQWHDWRWQLRHAAGSAQELAAMVKLSDDEYGRIASAVSSHVPFGVTPYYASLFANQPDEGYDLAIRSLVIPPEELPEREPVGEPDGDYVDFMKEGETSPVDMVTRRYPAIAILKPCTVCPQVCVYCQRNWELDGIAHDEIVPPGGTLTEAIEWIADHPTIREVLVTGGDPLVLSDHRLRLTLEALGNIDHIERIRVGTRTPVTMPMRITDEVADMLAGVARPGYREVCVMTHFEHVAEITPEAVEAVTRLRRRGIPVYNQLVYTFFVSRRFEAAQLRRKLRLAGVDPYYTFYPKAKNESAAYRVPLARILQEQKEEARLSPGLERTDEPVYNVPGLGKNHLNARQHRDLISVLRDGSRVWEFHPWEKRIAAQKTYIGNDVPILDYLTRLGELGEDLNDYRSIWYYF